MMVVTTSLIIAAAVFYHFDFTFASTAAAVYVTDCPCNKSSTFEGGFSNGVIERSGKLFSLHYRDGDKDAGDDQIIADSFANSCYGVVKLSKAASKRAMLNVCTKTLVDNRIGRTASFDASESVLVVAAVLDHIKSTLPAVREINFKIDGDCHESIKNWKNVWSTQSSGYDCDLLGQSFVICKYSVDENQCPTTITTTTTVAETTESPFLVTEAAVTESLDAGDNIQQDNFTLIEAETLPSMVKQSPSSSSSSSHSSSFCSSIGRFNSILACGLIIGAAIVLVVGAIVITVVLVWRARRRKNRRSASLTVLAMSNIRDNDADELTVTMMNENACHRPSTLKSSSNSAASNSTPAVESNSSSAGGTRYRKVVPGIKSPPLLPPRPPAALMTRANSNFSTSTPTRKGSSASTVSQFSNGNLSNNGKINSLRSPSKSSAQSPAPSISVAGGNHQLMSPEMQPFIKLEEYGDEGFHVCNTNNSSSGGINDTAVNNSASSSCCAGSSNNHHHQHQHGENKQPNAADDDGGYEQLPCYIDDCHDGDNNNDPSEQPLYDEANAIAVVNPENDYVEI